VRQRPLPATFAQCSGPCQKLTFKELLPKKIKSRVILPFDEIQTIDNAALLDEDVSVGQRLHSNAGAQSINFAWSPFRQLRDIVKERTSAPKRHARQFTQPIICISSPLLNCCTPANLFVLKFAVDHGDVLLHPQN
jgi:hypothetical protein